MTGYVTKADPAESGETVRLRIPNKEVAKIFQNAVTVHFQSSLDSSTADALLKALWEGDGDGASKHISDLLWNTISYNDYHEDYYHAFLTGIFVGRGYAVDSNKEWDLGRPDILLKDKKNRRAIIIEAKKSKSASDMDADCKAALAQISKMQYADALEGYTQVMKYGIAFYRKQARIKLG